MFNSISPNMRLPFLALGGFFLASCASGSAKTVSSSVNPNQVHEVAQPHVVSVVEDKETRKTTRFAEACEKGDGKACVAFSLRLEHGLGIPMDLKRAVERLATTCEQGYVPACEELAAKYDTGRGINSDSVRAVDLYAKACRLWSSNSCTRVFTMVEKGRRGTGGDPQRRRSLLEGACKGGEGRACFAIDTDDCNTGIIEGCYHLALSLDDGRGVEQDKKRAVELYAQACKGGQNLACVKGALMTHYGAMLKGLEARSLAPCRDPAPSNAVLMTVRVLRLIAGAPELPVSDLNVAQEPANMVTGEAARLTILTGEAWLKEAPLLLAAPATLVVQVKSEVPAAVIADPDYLVGSSRSGGRFKPGSLTVRLVRFNSKAKATCATEVTLKNEFLQLEEGETVVEGARRQLRGQVRNALGF